VNYRHLHPEQSLPGRFWPRLP